MKKTKSRTSASTVKSKSRSAQGARHSSKKRPASRPAREPSILEASAQKLAAQVALDRVGGLVSSAAPLVAPVAKYMAGNISSLGSGLGRSWRSASLRRKATVVVGTGLVVAVVLVAARRMNARARLARAADLDGLLKTAHPKAKPAPEQGDDAKLPAEIAQGLRRDSRQARLEAGKQRQQQLREKQSAVDKSSRIREISSMHAHGRRS